MVFPLIVFPYISRVLLPDNVGKVNFGTAFISYFALIASLGCSAYAIRACSAVKNDRAQLSYVASQIFSINIYTTFLAYICLAASLIFFRQLDSYRILIIVQSTSILLSTLGADWINTAMEDFKYITLRTFGMQLVSLVAIFLLVRTPDDYMIYAVISVISTSGANLLNLFYRRKFCSIRFYFKPEWKKHIKPILLLFTMILAQTVFKNTDMTMLGLIKSDYEVGIYSTAVKVYNIINQLVTSIVWVLLPRISFLFSQDNREELQSILKKALGFLVGLGLPIIAGILVTADDVILLCAGAEFASAAMPLRILMISFFFSLVGGGFMGNIILIPSKRESHFLVACVIAAVVNVILNALTIPIYGENAAAFSTGVAELIIFLYLLPPTIKTVKLRGIWKVLLAPAIGSAAIIGLGLLINHLIPDLMWLRLSVTITACVAVYGLILLILRYELLMDTLKKILRRFKKA
ncbi:MAG: flippase [Clostridia bacterium]|nr:flippase [Clostridia bacterium]